METDDLPETQELPQMQSTSFAFKSPDKQIGVLLVDFEKEHPIKLGANVIGRDPKKCDVVIDNDSISKVHAVIRVKNPKQFFLVDIKSMNGTKCKSKSLLPHLPVPFEYDDKLEFGSVFAMLRHSGQEESQSDLPMTQVLDTPASQRHALGAQLRQLTVPESPDVSDRDDSFVMPSRPPSAVTTPINQTNNIVGKKNNNDSVFWKAPTRSPSLKFDLDDSGSSLNGSDVGIITNKKDSGSGLLIHEMDTQIPEGKEETGNETLSTQLPGRANIHAMETQIPDNSEIHLAETQLPISDNIIHNMETQMPEEIQKTPPKALINISETKDISIYDAQTQILNDELEEITSESREDPKYRSSTYISESDEEIIFDEVDTQGFEIPNSQPLLNDSESLNLSPEIVINKIFNSSTCGVKVNDENVPSALKSIALNQEHKPNDDDDDLTDCEEDVIKSCHSNNNKLKSDDKVSPVRNESKRDGDDKDLTDCEKGVQNYKLKRVFEDLTVCDKDIQKNSDDEDLTDCEEEVVKKIDNKANVTDLIVSSMNLTDPCSHFNAVTPSLHNEKNLNTKRNLEEDKNDKTYHQTLKHAKILLNKSSTDNGCIENTVITSNQFPSINATSETEIADAPTQIIIDAMDDITDAPTQIITVTNDITEALTKVISTEESKEMTETSINVVAENTTSPFKIPSRAFSRGKSVNKPKINLDEDKNDKTYHQTPKHAKLLSNKSSAANGCIKNTVNTCTQYPSMNAASETEIADATTQIIIDAMDDITDAPTQIITVTNDITDALTQVISTEESKEMTETPIIVVAENTTSPFKIPSRAYSKGKSVNKPYHSPSFISPKVAPEITAPNSPNHYNCTQDVVEDLLTQREDVVEQKSNMTLKIPLAFAKKSDIRKDDIIGSDKPIKSSNFYCNTQEVMNDLVSQNKDIVPSSQEDYDIGERFPHITMNMPSSDAISPSQEKSNLSSQQVRDIIGVSNIISNTDGISDTEDTPKKGIGFYDDLPLSEEIKERKTCGSALLETGSTMSEDEKSAEENSDSDSPVVFRKRKAKEKIKINLASRLNLDNLPTRISKRARKPAEKFKDNPELIKSIVNQPEEVVELEIIRENVKKIRGARNNVNNISTLPKRNNKPVKILNQNKNVEKKTTKTMSPHVKENLQKAKTTSTVSNLHSENDNIKSTDNYICSSDKLRDIPQPVRRSSRKNNSYESKSNNSKEFEKQGILRESTTSARNSWDKSRVYSIIEQSTDSSSPDSRVNSLKPIRNSRRKRVAAEVVTTPSKRLRSSVPESTSVVKQMEKYEKQNISKKSATSARNLSDKNRVDRTLEHSTDSSTPDSRVNSPNPIRNSKQKRVAEDVVNKPTKRLRSSVPESTSTVITHRVLFTAYDDENRRNLLVKLGAAVVNDVKDCTVVVTKEIKRTFKFLCAVGLGRPIVGEKWVKACENKRTLVDPWSYILKDVAAEKKFKFSLRGSLRGARHFLAGCHVTSTPSIVPVPDEMRQIVECSGGAYREGVGGGGERWLVMSEGRDRALWPALRRRGATLVSRELVLTGVLRQRLEVDGYAIRS